MFYLLVVHTSTTWVQIGFMLLLPGLVPGLSKWACLEQLGLKLNHMFSSLSNVSFCTSLTGSCFKIPGKDVLPCDNNNEHQVRSRSRIKTFLIDLNILTHFKAVYFQAYYLFNIIFTSCCVWLCFLHGFDCNSASIRMHCSSIRLINFCSNLNLSVSPQVYLFLYLLLNLLLLFCCSKEQDFSYCFTSLCNLILWTNY